MRPEAAELRISLEPRQQIVRDRRDRLVATQTRVQTLLLVAHGALLCIPPLRTDRTAALAARRSCTAPHPSSRSVSADSARTTYRSSPPPGDTAGNRPVAGASTARDRKSTRLNSSHLGISYAVFCLKT